MQIDFAPILLFTYKRIDTLERTVESLKLDKLALMSDLFIFSDGPKHDQDIDKVNTVRAYIKSIKGFRSVTVYESNSNNGLAKSIIQGVTQKINKYGKVIVLEDDLVVADNFLSFMNKALNVYESNDQVYSISGFMFDIKRKQDYPYDVFFTRRHCSWGWAMWKDRWNEIDWNVSDYSIFINSSELQRKFNEIGADLTGQLIRQQKGEINSWAIRCNYHQFKKGTYTVYPIKSKIVNIGFTEDATHTSQRFNKYYATLDSELKYEFNFPESVFEDKLLIRRFKSKYSLTIRVLYSILNKVYSIAKK